MIAHDVRRVIAQAPALVETALGDDARRDRAIRVAGDDQRLVATHQRAVYVRDWHADDRGGRRQHQREVPVGAEHVHRTGVVADGKVPRQLVLAPLRHDGERGDWCVDLDRGDEAEVIVPSVASFGHGSAAVRVQVRRG